MNQPEDKRQKPQIITSPNSRDDPLRIQPARCYHAAQTRPAPKATQTRIEKIGELPPGDAAADANADSDADANANAHVSLM